MEKINIEERVQKARDLFAEGYNCTQSVFLTYCDVFGMDFQLAAKIAAPFGGGMGRMHEVCGSVSGMSLIAGMMEPVVDPSDKESKKRNYALVQEFAEPFRKEYGTIICRELLALGQKKDNSGSTDRPSENHKKRPCIEYVATAARIVGENLQQQS